MGARDKKLKEAQGGVYAPQHYDEKIQDYDFTKGTDGATHVYVYNPIAEHVLQNNATAAGNGNTYEAVGANKTLTLEITGTSTSRTVAFEMAGPAGVFLPQTVFNVNDPTKFGPQTTGGSTTVPESWQVDVPAGYKFRAVVKAVAGGNVQIKCWAVG